MNELEKIVFFSYWTLEVFWYYGFNGIDNFYLKTQHNMYIKLESEWNDIANESNEIRLNELILNQIEDK